MKIMPEIGSRVAYHSTVAGQQRDCTGVVVAHYPGYGEKCRDSETGETWVQPDFVMVQVDFIPSWWPYPESDRFAPEIANLTAVAGPADMERGPCY